MHWCESFVAGGHPSGRPVGTLYSHCSLGESVHPHVRSNVPRFAIVPEPVALLHPGTTSQIAEVCDDVFQSPMRKRAIMPPPATSPPVSFVGLAWNWLAPRSEIELPPAGPVTPLTSEMSPLWMLMPFSHVDSVVSVLACIHLLVSGKRGPPSAFSSAKFDGSVRSGSVSVTAGLNSSELVGDASSGVPLVSTVLISYQNLNVGESSSPAPVAADGFPKFPCPAATSLTRSRMSHVSQPDEPHVTSRRTSLEIQLGKCGRPDTTCQAGVGSVLFQ